MIRIELYQVMLIASLVMAVAVRPNTPKAFLPFIVVFVSIEMANKVLKELFPGMNTMPIQNTSALASVAYYLSVFLRSSQQSWIRPALTFYCTTVIISLINQGPRVMMSAAYIPGMLMTMGAICYYLYQLVVKSEYAPLARIPQFWMAVGILLFFSSAFPMLVFGNALTAADMALASQLWPLVSYGNVFLALGFLAVSLCQLNTRTSSSPSP